MINKVGKVSEPHDLRFNTYVAPPIYQDVPVITDLLVNGKFAITNKP